MKNLKRSFLLLVVLASLVSCFSREIDYQAPAGLVVLTPRELAENGPDLRLLDERGLPLVDVEVELWAHENLGFGGAQKWGPRRRHFKLVPIAGGRTNSEGRIPIEVSGRAFGVDPLENDDLRLMIHQPGRLPQVYFLQDLRAATTIVIPVAPASPAAARIMRFIDGRGDPVSGLTLRATEEYYQRKEPNPYLRCRFGPSDAEGRVFLPAELRDKHRFEVETPDATLLTLVTSSESAVGVLTEESIVYPGFIEVELDALALSGRFRGSLRSSSPKETAASHWFHEQDIAFEGGTNVVLRLLDAPVKRLDLEPAGDERSWVGAAFVEDLPGAAGVLRRRYQLNAATVPELEDRIQDEAGHLRDYDLEIRSRHRAELPDLDFRYRVRSKVAEDRSYRTPLFPEAGASYELARPHTKGTNLQRNGEHGLDLPDSTTIFIEVVFMAGRDDPAFFPPAMKPYGREDEGLVVDENGRPCAFARVDVYTEGDRAPFGFRSNSKLLYAFCDEDGRFRFQSEEPIREIDAQLGARTGSVSEPDDSGAWIIEID